MKIYAIKENSKITAYVSSKQKALDYILANLEYPKQYIAIKYVLKNGRYDKVFSYDNSKLNIKDLTDGWKYNCKNNNWYSVEAIKVE